MKKLIVPLLLLFVAICTVSAQPTPPYPPSYQIHTIAQPGTSSLSSPIDSLIGNSSWSPVIKSVLLWIGFFGVVCKCFDVKLQAWVSDKLAYQTDAVNSDHDKFTLAILGSKPYRMLAFLFDIVFSLNLPSVDTYNAQLKAQNTPIQTGPAPTIPAPAK